MTASPTRWKVHANSDLRWRSWQDDSVLYHGASGDTHLLDPVAAEALHFLLILYVIFANIFRMPQVLKKLAPPSRIKGI